MSLIRRFGSADFVLLLAVVIVAAGSRIWYLSACADHAQTEGPLQVQDGLPALRDQAGVHNGTPTNPLDAFSHGEETTAHTAPGYAFFLTALELSHLSPVDRTARWTQCGLGTLAAAFYFLFALRAFGSRWVALLTGLFCALDPFWIINTAEIKDGVLATFLLSLCLLCGIRASQSGGAITSLIYGLALAALALVRATLLPFAVVAMLWFLLRCRTVRRGWLCAVVAFLGFVNGLAPWMLRNFKATGDLVPVVDTAYLHLWEGNNPQATGGPQGADTLLDSLAHARGQDRKAVAEELAKLSQKERYGALAGDVVKEVRSNPAATLRRRLQAGLNFLFGEEWFKQGVLWKRTDTPETQLPDWLAGAYPALLYGSLLGMLALGLLGWRWTYGWRSEAMPSSLALVWIPLPYVLSHAGMLQGPRLPLDGILLCYAAFAIVYLIPPIGAALWSGGGYADEGGYRKRL
jgi:4-amino-4-deoxy-L-arabinose transferase-like glycosyltransferase